MNAKQQSGKAIVLHTKDNTATALESLVKESELYISDINPIILQDNIQFGHKFALAFIARGERVFKYGVPIGMAMSDIQIGEHIHLHNLQSRMQTTAEPEKQYTGVNENEGIQESGWKNRNT